MDYLRTPLKKNTRKKFPKVINNHGKTQTFEEVYNPLKTTLIELHLYFCAKNVCARFCLTQEIVQYICTGYCEQKCPTLQWCVHVNIMPAKISKQSSNGLVIHRSLVQSSNRRNFSMTIYLGHLSLMSFVSHQCFRKHVATYGDIGNYWFVIQECQFGHQTIKVWPKGS